MNINTICPDRTRIAQMERDLDTEKFIDGIKAILPRVKPLSNEQITEITRLMRSTRQPEHSFSGQCLHCKEQTTYELPLATCHVVKGDTWLKEKIKRWDSSTVYVNLSKNTINKLSFDTVYKYTCADCWNDQLLPLIRKEEENGRQRDLIAYKQELEREKGILSGEIRATPAKVYWTFKCHHTDEYAETLRSMNYQDFLKTRYWKAVRNYVMYKRPNKCYLCPSTDNLHVHHSTYQHRGSEIHYLQDLVILCNKCHARHHDKLA